MKLSWKLFTESRRSAIKESTVANSIALPMTNFDNLVDTKTIAALTFFTPVGNIKSLYRPRRLPAPDGSTSSIVYGNAFNQHGFVGPMKLDTSPGRFCGILSEADMDAFDIVKPQAIPADIAAANNLGDVILGVFSQGDARALSTKVPRGTIV